MTLGASGARGAASSAPEFSADIISVDATGRLSDRGRLYVAGSKVRIETVEAAAGFFLIDSQLGSALFVRPAQQLFMDARQSSSLTQLFVRVDAGDPCPALHEAAERAGSASARALWRCERSAAASSASAPERDLLEYHVVADLGPTREGWVDASLQFPVRWRSADGTIIELAHVRRAEQPESLFELPANYRKLDPGALIDRIRHSDVWADRTR